MNREQYAIINEGLFSEGFEDYEDYIAFYQALVDTGLAWQLEGFYGREAARLIEAGEIEVKEN